MTKTNSIAAKLSVAVVAVAMAFTLVAPSAKAQDVSSMSLEQLVALVNSLQAQISGSASVGSCSYTFTRSLSTGSTGADVMNLQKFLNMSADTQVAAAGSAGGPGSETSYYGPATAAAVSKFQTKYSADILVPSGLTSPTGYFGPASMAKANALCAGMTGGDDDDDTASGDLEGGAGDLAQAEFMSSLNNEEVGEDEEDVEVAGLEIEAEGSDIEITAVNLDFDYADSGQSDDFDDYASEVSIWVDGEEVARVDVSDMDDDDWNENISLDEGAIIREGDTGELVVAVSAASNIDDTDIGENWNVQFKSVRFRDAQGAVVTETSVDDIDNTSNDDTSTGSYERQFSFESFATSNDIEVKVSKGDDEINDARSIFIDDTNDTNGEDVMSFEVEVEGDSDIALDELVVEATTTGAAHLDEMINGIYLEMDGEEVGSENVPTDEETVTFDNLDLTLEAGETYTFTVVVDFLPTSGAIDVGDTIKFSVGTTERNLWDMEDDNGDDIATGDRTGSASNDAHAVYEDGMMVDFVSATETEVAGDSNDDDYVTLTIKFDVTAYGDTVYVDKTVDKTGSTTAGTSYGVDLSDAQGTYIAAASSSAAFSSTGDAGTNGFEVSEGETESFTLTVTVQNAATSTFDGDYVRAVLTSVGFNTDDSTTWTNYTSRLADDFKTDFGFIAN